MLKKILCACAIGALIVPLCYGQDDSLAREGWKVLDASAVPKTAIRTMANRKVRFSNLVLPEELTIVNFWATWCAPCVEELPDLQRLHQDFESQALSVILVNSQEDPESTQKFLQELGITVPSYYDTRGRLGNQFGVRGMPVSFLVNQQQQVFARYVGVFSWTDENFARALMDLL